VVIVNVEVAKNITATVELPNEGNFVVASPENLRSEPTTGTLQIPARSAVIIMEQ